MRLIKVAHLVNRIQDGLALLQEGRGVSSALDLKAGNLGQPGCLQEMALHGAQGHLHRLSPQGSLHSRVTHQQAFLYKTVDKRICIFIIGKLPGGAVEPKAATCGFGQVQVTAIHDCACRQAGHKSAGLELDAEELGVCMANRRSSAKSQGRAL